jgi:hypothetical protein
MREDDGFAGYVERHGHHLVQVGYLLSDDLTLARSVVERALSRAWLEWGRLGELPDPDAYFLRRLATNHRLRGDVRRGPLAGVAPSQRAAVVLRYFEGLPDGRMAGVMDLPQDEARAQLMAALATLDEPSLRTTLSERAQAVPEVALMPAIRSRADRVRRLRRAGIAAAGVLVLVVVGGVADLALTASDRAPSAAAKPTLDVSALVGHSWRLVSWTTPQGQVVRASTPMTLVFSSRTAARTVTPTGTTRWLLRLDKGGSTAVPGPVASDDGVVATVLQGTSSWQIVGDSLVWRHGPRSLTYTSSTQHG